MKIKKLNLLLSTAVCSTLLLVGCNSDAGGTPESSVYSGTISRSTSFIYTNGATNKYQLVISNQGKHTLKYSGASVIASSSADIKVDSLTNISTKCSIIKPNANCSFDVKVPKINNEQQLYIRYKFIDTDTGKDVFFDKYFVFKNVSVNDSALAISPHVEDYAVGNLSDKETITVPFVLWKKFKKLNVTVDYDAGSNKGAINCSNSSNIGSYAIGDTCSALVSLDTNKNAKSITIKGVVADNNAESSWKVDLTNFNAAHSKLGYPQLVYLNSPVILDAAQGHDGLHKQVTVMNVGNQDAINVAFKYNTLNGGQAAVNFDASGCPSTIAKNGTCNIKFDYESSTQASSIGAGTVEVDYASLNNPVPVQDSFSVLYKINAIAGMFLSATESNSFSDYSPSLNNDLPPPPIKRNMAVGDIQNVGSFVITANNQLIPVENNDMKKFTTIKNMPYFSLKSYGLTSSNGEIVTISDWPDNNDVKKLTASKVGDTTLKATAVIGTLNPDLGSYTNNTYTAYALLSVAAGQNNYLYIAFPGNDNSNFTDVDNEDSNDSVLQVFKYNNQNSQLELYKDVTVDTTNAYLNDPYQGSSITDMAISSVYSGSEQRLLLVDGFHGRLYSYIVKGGAETIVSRYTVPDQDAVHLDMQEFNDGLLKPAFIGVLSEFGAGFYIPHTINPIGDPPDYDYPSKIVLHKSNSANSNFEGVAGGNYEAGLNWWDGMTTCVDNPRDSEVDYTLYGCLTVKDDYLDPSEDHGDALLALQSITKDTQHYVVSLGYESMIFYTLDNYDEIAPSNNGLTYGPKLSVNSVVPLDKSDPLDHKIELTGINDNFSNALAIDDSSRTHIFFINPNNATLQQYDYSYLNSKLVDRTSEISPCTYKGNAQTRSITTVLSNGNEYLVEAYEDISNNTIYVNDYLIGATGVLQCNPDQALSNFSIKATNSNDWPRFAVGKNGVIYLLVGDHLNYGSFDSHNFDLSKQLTLQAPTGTVGASSLLTN